MSGLFCHARMVTAANLEKAYVFTSKSEVPDVPGRSGRPQITPKSVLERTRTQKDLPDAQHDGKKRPRAKNGANMTLPGDPPIEDL